MTVPKPLRPNTSLYRVLQDENSAEFNKMRASGVAVDLRGFDMRALDLRGFDLSGLALTNCYFRNTNLSGQDLTENNLQGASLSKAIISGVYFPPEISAEEVRLSLDYGTRIRYHL